MKTVNNNINEIIINKSKFITYTYHIDNVDEVSIKLDELKKEYKDATHICYAYIINSQEKCADDGEPSGTAGMPILNILQKEQLQNVLCVVIRYFGGIKLGAGGLVRAYARACKESLLIKELTKGYEIKVLFNYDEVKKIDYLLKNSSILSKTYDIKTCYIFKISEDDYNLIKDDLNNICETEYVKEIYI